MLFAVSGFLALVVVNRGDAGGEGAAEAYAGWAALSLFALVLLQVALIGLYVPQRETAGVLGWVGFLLAFFGATVAFFVILIDGFIALPLPPDHPGLLGAGPPGAFVLYFPLFSLGWLLLGVASLKSPLYPRPAALLLTVGAVLALHPHPLTSIVFGAAVAWLGLASLRGGAARTGNRGGDYPG